MRSRPTQDMAYSPGGSGARSSVAPPPVTVDEGVNAGGRIGDDAAGAIALGDQCGHMGVHCPGEALVAGRAELVAGHEDDVGSLRKPRQRFAVE
jgi:hypothetical protein